MYMSLNNTGGSWRRRRKLFHFPILNLLASTSLSLISSLWLQAKNWCLASTTRRTPLSCTGFVHIYNCKGGNWVNPTKKMITRPTFRRLEEMNQRWNYLKAKSIAIRWLLVLNSLILKANGTPPPSPTHAPGDDELQSNSNCLERLREFSFKMHWGCGGPFALFINIPSSSLIKWWSCWMRSEKWGLTCPFSDQFCKVKSIPWLLKNRKNVNNNEPFPYTRPPSLSLKGKTHRL